MSVYSDGVVNKEEFDISDKIGISDTIEVYTDAYPLLRAKRMFGNESYQQVGDSNIQFNSLSGDNFLSEDHIVSYLNLAIPQYNVYLNFGSDDNLYYNTVAVEAISGDFADDPPSIYTTRQNLHIGSRTRVKIAEGYGVTINLPAVPYVSGDANYDIDVSGNIDPKIYPYVDGDHFINNIIENGEVVLKPSSSNSLRSYNLISDNYSYKMSDVYYVSNQDLVVGQTNNIIIDEQGSSVQATYSGFDSLSYEIPFYIGDNNRYFKLYKQDDISSTSTRVALVEGTDYSIDYHNGKIKFYNTLAWDSETIPWIESYLYDKIYYKYIESARYEVGDIDSENYQYSHRQMRKMFHKSLQKVLFWIPLSYSSETGRIVPELDDKMVDFVSEMCKIIVLQNVLNKNIGSGIKVKDGDTSLDLTSGLRPGKEISAMQLKEMKEKLRAEIDEYALAGGSMGMHEDASQGVTGSL